MKTIYTVLMAAGWVVATGELSCWKSILSFALIFGCNELLIKELVKEFKESNQSE